MLIHSICFCIPRHRRDRAKARGIYLISNWRVATIYRVQAKREHIESAKRHIDRRKNKSKNRRCYPFILALSVCKYGFGLSPFEFDRSNAMLALCGEYEFSAKNLNLLDEVFLYP